MLQGAFAKLRARFWCNLCVKGEDLQVSLSVEAVPLLNIIVHIYTLPSGHRCGLRVDVTKFSTLGRQRTPLHFDKLC